MLLEIFSGLIFLVSLAQQPTETSTKAEVPTEIAKMCTTVEALPPENAARITLNRLRNFVRDAISTPTLPGFSDDCASLGEILSKFRSISLRGQGISDLTPLAPLKQITVLELDDNMISNLGPLARLENLRHLSMAGNQISDLSPLRLLRNLGEVHLEDNNITSVEPLGDCRRLYLIDISHNKVDNIMPLFRLADFKVVAPYNRISRLGDMTVGSRHFSLEIDVSRNAISDLSGFVPVEGLRLLNLTGNPIPIAEVEVARKRLLKVSHMAELLF